MRRGVHVLDEKHYTRAGRELRTMPIRRGAAPQLERHLDVTEGSEGFEAAVNRPGPLSLVDAPEGGGESPRILRTLDGYTDVCPRASPALAGMRLRRGGGRVLWCCATGEYVFRTAGACERETGPAGAFVSSREREFARVITTLKEIQHPHVVQLLDVVRGGVPDGNGDSAVGDPATPCVVDYHMLWEFIPYVVTLDDRVGRARRLDEGVARRYTIQIASALQCMHARGLRHGDLSARAVLIDGDDNVKISRVARCAYGPSPYSARPMIGTIAHVAPEVILGGSHVGPAADVYSAGLLLYYMLVGRHAFEAPGFCWLAFKIVEGSIEYPRFVRGTVRGLIKAMTRKDPEERLGWPQVGAHAWVGVREARHATAVPASTARPATS